MVIAARRQDSRFFTHTLPNGLQMLGQQIPGVLSAASVFWVCTGTRDEPIEHMGVSHFLEHMAFRRTAHFTGEEIDRAFEEIGADHNAGTWLEMTFYWSKALGENLPRSLEILAELINPVLDEEDFNQERRVILEEIARYEDQAPHVLLSHFMRDYFGDHPLSRETLGTTDTIKNLTVEQMRQYFRQKYGTRNMLFSVAGNFDWDEVVQQVQALTSEWQPGLATRDLSPAAFRPAVHVHQTDRFTQQQVALGTPSVNRSDPRYFQAAVLATIFGDDTGSRLYWAVQQKGLAETASASLMEFEDNGMLLVYLAAEPEHTREALEAVQRELARVQEFDLTEEELSRAKAKLNSSVIIGGESTNERVMGLIRSWLAENRLETLEEIRSRIDSVSLDDLKKLVEDFPVAPRQVIGSLGPLSAEALPAGM